MPPTTRLFWQGLNAHIPSPAPQIAPSLLLLLAQNILRLYKCQPHIQTTILFPLLLATSTLRVRVVLVHGQIMDFGLIEQELLGISQQVTLDVHEDLVVEVVHVRVDAAGHEQLRGWGRGGCVEMEGKEGEEK